MSRQSFAVAVAAVMATVLVWALTGGGGLTAKLKASVQAKTPEGYHPIRTGITPPPYQPQYGEVPGGLAGHHPLYAHPRRMSPGMDAQMRRGYDWMFCPPSEEDL